MLNPDHQAMGPRTAEHKHDGSQIEYEDQLDQRSERADSIATDRERHRAEGAERRQAHDHVDGAEHQHRSGIDHVTHRFGALAEPREHVAEQDRDQHDRQNISARERIDDGVGNDVEQELDDRLLLGLAGVLRNGLRVQRRRIDVEAGARRRRGGRRRSRSAARAWRRPRNRAAPFRRPGRPSSCPTCRRCPRRRCRR